MKKILAIIFLALLLGLAGFFMWSNMTFSDGSRAGYLIKISKKGVVFKTYEGQLNLSPLGFDSAPTGQNIWEFSVLDEKVYEELLANEGKRLSLHYVEKMRAFPWQGETNYFIDEVKVIE